MDLLYAIFFGAGVTAFAYNKLGRRIGYGNSQSIAKTLAVIFVFSTLVFFTILALVIHV